MSSIGGIIFSSIKAVTRRWVSGPNGESSLELQGKKKKKKSRKYFNQISLISTTKDIIKLEDEYSYFIFEWFHIKTFRFVFLFHIVQYNILAKISKIWRWGLIVQTILVMLIILLKVVIYFLARGQKYEAPSENQAH